MTTTCRTVLLCFILLDAFQLAAQGTTIHTDPELDSLIIVTARYIEKGQYQQALEICTQSIQKVTERMGNHSDYVAKLLFQEGRIYNAQGQLAKSETAYLSAKDILESIYGAASDEYLSVLNNLGTLYGAMGRYVQAETVIQEILSFYEKSKRPANRIYLNSLGNLGIVYRLTGRYAAAEALYIRMFNIREIVKDTTAYTQTMTRLATLYADLDRYQEADSLYQCVLRMQTEKYGREHPAYANTLGNLTNVYREMGAFEKSEQAAITALNILEKVHGKAHPAFARVLSNTSNFYAEMGDFEKAETLQMEALSIRKTKLGKEHPDYAQSLNNLANIYRKTGQYEKAELFHHSVLDARRISLGTEHPVYATSLNNLGIFYADLGVFEKAEQYMIEAADIQLSTLGERHGDYAQSLSNLAVLYSHNGRIEKALNYMEQSLKISQEISGDKTPVTAKTITTLAGILMLKGELATVDSLLQTALSVQETVLGKKHPDYLRTLLYQANFFYKQGRFDQALSLYDELKTEYRSVYGDAHPILAELNIRAARCCKVKGDDKSALSFLLEANAATKDLISRSFLFLSSSEIASFNDRLRDGFDDLNALSFNGYDSPELKAALFENLLFQKGMLLQNTLEIRAAAQMDTATRALVRQIRLTNSRIAELYSKPLQDRKYLSALTREAENLEKSLTRTLAGYAASRRQADIQALRDSLRSTDALVEFGHFVLKNRYGAPTDSIIYFALLLLPQDHSFPHFVPLFEEKQLALLLEKTGGNTPTLFATRSGELLDPAPAYGTALYNLIWHPLDSLLKHTKTVYYSPSGLLHRVAFAALPAGGKKVLSDKYQLRQLGSARSLVMKYRLPVRRGHYAAAVFGGVQYDRNTTAAIADSANPEIKDNRLWTYPSRPRSSTDTGFDYLPGTNDEVRKLAQTFRKNGMRVQAYTGAEATEEALKFLGHDTIQSPDVLHIATHGFFFPARESHTEPLIGEENVFQWNENPLFRSGLALAGANAAWAGTPASGNIEDGILTAYEISHLNLSNTKLAVLSACQTALGDIKGSEGVYGLQRAFKMAGVDYLLVSLWPVPDRETAEFMEVFYNSWLGGKTIHDAFSRAQRKMRKRYKEVEKWGAWVLLE